MNLQLPLDHLIDQDRETIEALISDYLSMLDIQAQPFDWSIEVKLKEEASQ